MTTTCTRLVAAVTVAVGALAGASCGNVAQQGRSPVQVAIMKIEGATGVAPTVFGNPLLSDVQTMVTRTINGQQVAVPTIFNDLGRADFVLVLKDQGSPGVSAAPSAVNQVTFNRYRVIYRRADGRNTAGVDVPFPFDGAVTFTVPASGTVTAAFELVRVQAKQEAPLLQMVGGGGQAMISTFAEITFYGADLAGNQVSVTGTIAVNFGDFADPS